MGDTTPTFDAEGNSGEYQNFVSTLRSTLGSGDSFRDVPVLPEQNLIKPPLIDILLRVDSVSLRLWLRSDSLYLERFRRNGVIGGYLFQIGITGDQPPHSDVRYLGFNGDYTSLELVANTKRLDLPLGQTPFARAVRQLATLSYPITPESKSATATSLLVVTQMISESVRFKWISDYLTKNWTPSSNPPPYMVDLEAAWGTLSESLIHSEQDPNHFRLPDNDFGFKDADDVSKVLGMLLRRSIQPTPRTNDRDWLKLYPTGRVLAEIISVHIERLLGPIPGVGELYGTIKVIDALGSQDIYNQERINSEKFSNYDITLTGPGRSILADDSFIIKMDLWGKGHDSSPDDHIIQAQIPWNPYDVTNHYSQVIAERIGGSGATTRVQYIVLKNAVQAFVEVTVDSGDGDDLVNVYGTITAHTGYGTILLFQKDENNHVDVHLGDKIPLLRSTAAVLLGTKPLIITASLYDWNPNSPNGEIAEGSCDFLPDSTPESKIADITGQYGKITVKVSWEAVNQDGADGVGAH